MICPSESLLAVHVDGELRGDEARSVERHLSECPRCRELAAALAGEGRMLAQVLEAAPGWEPAEPPTPWAEWVIAGALTFAALMGLRLLERWIGALGEATPGGLVDARSLMSSALFAAFFYLIRQGASMFTSLTFVAGLSGLLVVAAAVGIALLRRAARGPFLVATLLALAATPSAAFERRVTENGDVTVPAGTTLDDSLLAMGDTVAIDGVVTGNVLALARRVVVRGAVKGDLVTAAQRIELPGSIEGNVLGAAEIVEVSGSVGRSVHAFGKHLGIAGAGRVEGDALLFAEEANLEGRAGRDLVVFAALVRMRGEVGRNASAWADRVNVEGGGRIGGNLTAHVSKADRLSVDPAATVVGSTKAEVDPPARPEYLRPAFYVWKAIWLAAAFLTGLVLQRLFPSLFAGAWANRAAVARSFGIGFLALVAGPAVLVVAGVTLVGLPIALLGLAVWLAALYASGIVVGGLVGRALLVRSQGAAPRFALALAVGLVVVTVAVNMPYLGGVARALVVLFGMGTIAIQAWRAWRTATWAA
jgi:cytoskeletal protein CcmA (bactofilin family)/anti-sigma factor RsiW